MKLLHQEESDNQLATRMIPQRQKLPRKRRNPKLLYCPNLFLKKAGRMENVNLTEIKRGKAVQVEVRAKTRPREHDNTTGGGPMQSKRESSIGPKG